MMIELAEGKPFYGLLESDGPERGEVLCPVTEEEFFSMSERGNPMISMSWHQGVPSEVSK